MYCPSVINSHPEMNRYLAKPLILLLATYYRYPFESPDIHAEENFKTWLPKLSQFFGPRNTVVNRRAMQHCVSFVETVCWEIKGVGR